MIGDPSGRSTERNLLDVDTLEANVAAIRVQLERFLDFTPELGRGHGQQPRLARTAVADRLPARHRQALHDPVHARQGLGPGPARARAVVHRVQLHAAPVVRLRPPAPDVRRRAPDGRRRPVGQHHRRPRAHPADERPADRRDGAIRPTGSPTSCCSRRRAPSSARARAAIRSGSTRRAPRRTRSTSTGSTPTTATSARTCAGSPSCRATRSRRSRPSWRARPRAGRRSGRSRSTSRPGRTARRPPPARSPIPRPSSRPPRSTTRPSSPRSTSPPAGSRSIRRCSAGASRSCLPRPACSPRGARRGG